MSDGIMTDHASTAMEQQRPSHASPLPTNDRRSLGGEDASPALSHESMQQCRSLIVRAYLLRW